MSTLELPRLDADSLKTRFKERCLVTSNAYQNWQIRVHRSLSWLKRADAFGEDQPEARFLYLWISLNSLYSHWDPVTNAAGMDAEARRAFIDRLCSFNSGLISQALRDHRGLVKKILSNPYLSDVFWREPENPKAKGWAAQDAHHIDQNFKANAYNKVLQQVLGRLSVFRGQLVHGASTGGSSLNRTTLRHSVSMLGELVPIILHIVIEHGCNDDWPALCYPPIH